ncbi:MBL fold metallo-hydrolase [Microbacterium panaciterrae]|uniref:MBL fold metallo-hydrolase n=1 Tax=Microbacterium panaciterrae TaxID=985759 RepID=A0ABP8PNE2_9MICO
MTDEWIEVARGVFQRRYEPMDVSVGVIAGRTGVTVVDTRNNPAEAAEIVRDVEERFALPILPVVNTHAHYDHTFGNQIFAERDIPIYGHRLIPEHFAQYERPRLQKVQEHPESEPDEAWAQVRLTPPTVLIDAPRRIDVGGRVIELRPLPPGHTDTDLAVLVPDVRAWFLGDVVEESGPSMFGSGSYPLDWPGALDVLLERIRPGDVLVPGHGSVIDRDFIVRQASRLRAVADGILAAYSAGVSPEDAALDPALQAWWPESFLRSALRAGYVQLARGERMAGGDA